MPLPNPRGVQMSNRRTLLSVAAFAVAVSFTGIALAAPPVIVSSPAGAVVHCRTVQETDCTVDSHGHVSNCHTGPVTECTIVSGPGSGKAMQRTSIPPGNGRVGALGAAKTLQLSNAPGNGSGGAPVRSLRGSPLRTGLFPAHRK